MKMTLDMFLNQFVREDEFIVIFDTEGENLFTGTAGEFYSGKGYYPYVPETRYNFDKIYKRYVYRVGIDYKGEGLEIIIR